MFTFKLHESTPTAEPGLLPPRALPDVSSFWRPAFPGIERRIPPASNLNFAVKLLRLGWVLFLLPLHLALVLGHHLSPAPSVVPPPGWVPGVTRQWTVGQRVLYPVAGRLVWALTGIGQLVDYGAWLEREVPPFTRVLMWLLSLGRIRMEVELIELSDVARAEEWVRGEAADPMGVVRPERVAGFWVNGQRDKAADRLKAAGLGVAKRRVAGGRVVLYLAGKCSWFPTAGVCTSGADSYSSTLSFETLAGGGYCAGHPAEFGRAFAITRDAPVPYLHINCRKATHPDKAFPGVLLDALAGYAHLVQLGYDEIVVGGDSSGAAVAISLTLYLANTLAQSSHPPPSLILPVAVLACSPWADLTLSTSTNPSITDCNDDILTPAMLANASNHYLSHLSALDPQARAAQPATSPARLLATHPFFSPALPTSLPALQQLSRAYSGERPLRWLVFCGTAELFADEARALVFGLEQAALAGGAVPGKAHAMEVEAAEYVDEVHCGYLIFPRFVSPAAGEFWARVDRFVGGA